MLTLHTRLRLFVILSVIATAGLLIHLKLSSAGATNTASSARAVKQMTQRLTKALRVGSQPDSAVSASPTLATITVTNSGDGAATAANCPGASCRLRDAIAAAAAGDTIDFANGISSIALASGELVINKNLIIQGPGANLLTVQNTAAASATSRVFNISSGTVTLAGMTISGGNLTGGASGGGILNSGSDAPRQCGDRQCRQWRQCRWHL